MSLPRHLFRVQGGWGHSWLSLHTSRGGVLVTFSGYLLNCWIVAVIRMVIILIS